jgi:hypothetical protein
MNLTTSTAERPPSAEPALQAYERSGYVEFAEYCSRLAPEPKEIADLVGTRWSLKPSLFHLSASVATHLGVSLNLEPAAWSRSLGQDLLDGASAKAVLLGELRYCRACLCQGWHSAVHQHPAFRSCLLHGEPFRCGCWHCGAPIATSAFAIARNHLHCGVCGRSLATDRRRASPAGPVLQMPREGAEALRQALTGSFSGKGTRSPFRYEVAPAQVARCTTLSKALAFHRVWPDVQTAGLRAFQEVVCRLSPGTTALSQSEVNRRARAAAAEALSAVAAMLDGNGGLEPAPLELCTNSSSAARVDMDISLVSAGFWRTAATFRVLRQVRGELPPPDARVPPFSELLPFTAGALETVVNGQVFGLLAFNLIEMKRLSYAAEVAWNQAPSAYRFCPAWITSTELGRTEVHVRPWATEHAVSRLIRRYRARRLQRVPDELRILDVVGGAGGADSEVGRSRLGGGGQVAMGSAI